MKQNLARLDGKVALITGGARGQGRSRALTLAREEAERPATSTGVTLPVDAGLMGK